MSGMGDCDRQAAAYLLGALEPSELPGFRRHLAECAVCQDEIEALEVAVQALPMAAPQYQAPRGLRRSVMRAVRQERTSGGRRSSRLLPDMLRMRKVLAGVAAAAVAGCGALAAVELSRGRTQVIQARVQGAGTAQLHILGDRGQLTVNHLSPPGPGNVYEVWLKAPNHLPTPTGVLFSVTSHGSANLGLPESLHGVSQVLVTPEPYGGTPVPTHRPVIVVQLT